MNKKKEQHNIFFFLLRTALQNRSVLTLLVFLMFLFYTGQMRNVKELLKLIYKFNKKKKALLLQNSRDLWISMYSWKFPTALFFIHILSHCHEIQITTHIDQMHNYLFLICNSHVIASYFFFLSMLQQRSNIKSMHTVGYHII